MRATESILQCLKGVSLPFTTPFTSSDEFDAVALRTNLRSWSSTGVTGYVVLGSTGERVHLDEHEYRSVIEAARTEVSDTRLLIAGAGQQSTRGTINEVKMAAKLGADVVLVITPHFYRAALTQENLIGYYVAVADASPVPVLLYSMPALTGVKMEPPTIARLSEHPNIIGAKDSSNDIPGFAETVRLCPDDFAVMIGNGTVFLDALKCGATGAILAVGCAVPEVCVEIFNLATAGDLDRAERLQANLTPLAAAVTTRFGIGGLKCAIDLAGYCGGDVRSPLQTPSETEREEIAALLNAVKTPDFEIV